METIYHLLGMCPDAHSHFDLLDLYLAWDSFMSYLSRFSLLVVKVKLIILESFK